MKLKWILVFAIVLLCSKSFCQEKITGFQSAKFGESYEEVKTKFPQIIGKKTVKGSEEIAAIPELEVAGKNGVVTFRFFENKLFEVAVLQKISCSSSGTESCINEFNRVKELLVQKYGVPGVLNTKREILGGKDMTETYLSLGSLAWAARWTTKDTGNQIHLGIITERFQTNLGLLYTDGSLSKSAKKARTKAHAGDL